jgi:uncharacterized repeat protein (TIGR01451 family)
MLALLLAAVLTAGNNTDNTGNGPTAVASADVSIVKTLLTAGPFHPGQIINYTLVIANAGPSTATNIQVTDTRTNMNFVFVGGACNALPCTIDSLASGANTTINVNAVINAAGAFDNSATAMPAELDPNTSNNTDNTDNGGTATLIADLYMMKTNMTGGQYYVGEPVDYQLLITNFGPNDATNLQVTDTPTNMTVTNVSGSGCSAVPCTIASLAGGRSTIVNVTATINAVGPFDNSATVIGSELDPTPSNNTDNTANGGVAGPAADISLTKTLVTPGPYVQGQTLTYTIVVANAGPSTASYVSVFESPTNLDITSFSGGGCSTIPCLLPSLASGASVTITMTAKIAASGAFDNSATALAPELDPNPSNNTDNTGNGGTTLVDLSITKTASSLVVGLGQTLDYTLTVRNNGPGAAGSVVVSDPVPSGWSLISATSTQGTCSGTTNVTCSVGTMGNGATVTITLHGTATALGSLVNTASVAAAQSETVTTNNTSTASVTVLKEIPTLSEWALVALVLMLALAGASLLRR